MTDENIMKALDCCVHDKCTECPYKKDGLCIENKSKDALDLIHRQKDEIEGLIVAQETLQRYVTQLNKELERANARSDTR